MDPLAPAQLKVFRARGAIAALILIGVAIFAEWVLSHSDRLPTGLILAPALLLAMMLVFFFPARSYHAWRYRVTDDELHVANGIWLRSRTVVPFGRVQHIDVSQGPIERRFGVGTLTLHTAGTRSSAVFLPGLELAAAERLRDEIRAQIRQDLT